MTVRFMMGIRVIGYVCDRKVLKNQMDWEKDIAPKLKGDKEVLYVVSNEPVNQSITLNGSNFKAPSFSISGIIFNSEFKIENISDKESITFAHCTFKSGLILKNIILKSPKKQKKRITFIECIFQENLWLSAIEMDGVVLFEKCTMLAQTTLNSLNMTSGVDFLKCNIHILYLTDNNMHFLNLINSSCYQTDIDPCTILGIVFQESNFNNRLFVSGVKANSIRFYGGEYKEVSLFPSLGTNIKIENGKFLDVFVITFDDVPRRSYENHGFLTIESCEFINGLQISGGLMHFIEEINLYLSTKMQGDILLSNLYVGRISMHGINSKATIKFDHVFAKQLFIHNFYNHAQLVLSNVKTLFNDWIIDHDFGDGKVPEKLPAVSKFSLYNSNLGKSQLYNCDFTSFSEVNIQNTILSEISTSIVKWFDHKKLISKYPKKKLKEFRKERSSKITGDYMVTELDIHREVYRQLKYASEKQGDRIQALEFQRWEMAYYKKYLQLIEGRERWQDRFILWSSQTNNFGQSWWKPIWVGFIFTFILYIPIALLGSDALKPFTFSFSGADIWHTLKELFYTQLPVYIQLVNPAHSLSSIYADIHSKPGLLYFFDGLHRIITAYFLFQIITAFRKYVRS